MSESGPAASETITLISSVGLGVSNTFSPSNTFFISALALRVLPANWYGHQV